MSKTFIFTYWELASMDVEVEAENEEEARRKLEEMKDTELRRYFSEDLQEIFGISPNDPAVRYLVLDTTEGRDGILLILAAAAVALLLIVVIIKKAKKKAPAPVAAAPAGADAPRPYDPEIR